MAHIPRLEVAEILKLYKFYKERELGTKAACEEVCKVYPYQWTTIYALVKRLEPTTGLAQTYIKAGALRLAKRIVAKASVAESIEVLSRPNIGVLESRQQATGGGGFFLSISKDSCGAFKMEAGTTAQNGGQHGQITTGYEGEGRDTVIVSGHRAPALPPAQVQEEGRGRGREEVQGIRDADEDLGRPRVQESAAAHIVPQPFQQVWKDGSYRPSPEDRGRMGQKTAYQVAREAAEARLGPGETLHGSRATGFPRGRKRPKL